MHSRKKRGGQDAQEREEVLAMENDDNPLAPRIYKAERAPCPGCGKVLAKTNYGETQASMWWRAVGIGPFSEWSGGVLFRFLE